MPRILTFTAGNGDAGRALRDIIKDEFHLVAHDIARAKYDIEGGITVDGVPAYTDRILRAGETLRVVLGDEAPGMIIPAEGPLVILYEDEDILAVDKPAGVVVHPSHGHFADTLANYVAAYYISKGEMHEVRMAGRLDKDTSGVVIFGKSRSACAALSGQRGEGVREKCYLAVVSGIIMSDGGTINLPISREYEEKIKRVVRADGAPASTNYTVIGRGDDYTVLALRISTGRTHQIRVHMAHTGHPLIGDPIYGNNSHKRDGIGRAALHAWKMVFDQPFTGKRIVVSSPLPEDIAGYFNSDALKKADEYIGAKTRDHYSHMRILST